MNSDKAAGGAHGRTHADRLNQPCRQRRGTDEKRETSTLHRALKAGEDECIHG